MASGDQNSERDNREAKAFDRMLAEALSRDAQKDCPDAETLAAFYDRALTAEETSRCRVHFAGCARCQQTLAALAASDPNPLAEKEIARLGELIAAANASPSTAPPRAKIVRRPWYFDPRTLVPLAAAAVFAGALWLAMRPSYAPQPPQSLSAESSENPAIIGQGETPVPEPSAAPAAHKPSSAASSTSSAPTSASSPAMDMAAAPAPPSPTPPAAPSAAESNSAMQQEARLPAANSASQQQERTDGATAPPPSAPQESPAAGEEDRRAAVPEPAPAATGGVAGGAAAEANSAMAGAAGKTMRVRASAPGGLVAATNNVEVLWRFGRGGSIERSTDGGATWMPQLSPVLADLLAGSAPSASVCWLVGRGGAIVRSVDGVTWEHLLSPKQAEQNGQAPNWTFIDARDASSAVIGDADGRRFTTNDGGKTWRQP